jgi:hypothetical protein
MRYIKENDLDWAIWALNGYQGLPENDETYGVLNHTWSGPRYPWMVRDLITI